MIYIGVTNDLVRRIYEHKQKIIKGFASRYNVDKLVYFERFTNINDAIAREKQLKAGPRKKKVELINNFNSEWKELYDEING